MLLQPAAFLLCASSSMIWVACPRLTVSLESAEAELASWPLCAQQPPWGTPGECTPELLSTCPEPGAGLGMDASAASSSEEERRRRGGGGRALLE